MAIDTDMVIILHVADIPNLSNFLPVGSVWCILIILTVKGYSTMTRWYIDVFYESVEKIAYSRKRHNVCVSCFTR